MYVLLNRENIVIDLLNNVRYIKLQSGTQYIVACPEREGTGVIGSDCNTLYTLAKTDTTNNPNAVTIMQFNELPENCKPNYWIYDSETNSLVERYTTGVESTGRNLKSQQMMPTSCGRLTRPKEKLTSPKSSLKKSQKQKQRYVKCILMMRKSD